jgi:hypothetical protein
VANQPENKPWQVEVSELLARAAERCAEHEIDLDSFMRGAYAAYLEARPGMREQLADMQLRLQLDEMRKLGRIATA